MAKGISLHIALNKIDPGHYGTNGALPYCKNDATAMMELACDEGYEVLGLLVDEEATSANVLMALTMASGMLEKGDILLLTYSGHGSFFPDINGDERDGYDETWVLYDRMFVDDELYFAWSKFRKGVRIVLVSDSCHSGTIAKSLIVGNSERETGNDRKLDVLGGRALVEILKSEAALLYKCHRTQYDQHLKHVPSPKKIEIGASVILLAASQDDQLANVGSVSGAKLSLFTDELLTVYRKSSGGMNYPSFVKAIEKRIPRKYRQTPNLYKVGSANKTFSAQRPFSI